MSATLDMSVSFVVECAVCGSDLEATVREPLGGRRHYIVVASPCQTCIEKAEGEAGEAGFERGVSEARGAELAKEPTT